MESLFASLTTAVAGAAPVALAAAFAWGVLSVLLSPCHLASIPLIVGFLQGQDDPSQRRALGLSTLFALGILITIAAIGAVTTAAGRLMGDVGAAGNILVAGVFFIVGLSLLDVIPLNLPTPSGMLPQRRGAGAALLLGLIFGIALGPCTFAYLAPLLGVAFKVAATSAVFGTALLVAYGLGHCLVIAAAGAGSAWVQRTLDWNADSRIGGLIKKTCGILVILAGLYLLHIAR
jgi:cytochrome c-type biogenesis protein